GGTRYALASAQRGSRRGLARSRRRRARGRAGGRDRAVRPGPQRDGLGGADRHRSGADYRHGAGGRSLAPTLSGGGADAPGGRRAAGRGTHRRHAGRPARSGGGARPRPDPGRPPPAGGAGRARARRRGEPASFALRMPEVVAAIRQAIASGQPQRVEFTERVPVDRWYEAHVTILHALKDAAERRIDLVLMTVRDLTPLHRVEEMRADFVANASHELRTPLAALSGFIETLQGPARDDAPARDRFLGIMKQQAFRMARLIDDLLSLSRIELNVHVRPDTPVDLVAIVRQVTDAMQMLARDRGVEVAVSAPAEPVIVRGDRDELV